MSEGIHFEEPEVSKSEKGSESDLELLERGEIIDVETLEGGLPTDVVEIKGFGKALFREDDEEFILERRNRKELLVRSDLELLAFKIDKVLGFNLIPAIVQREVKGRMGTAQKLLNGQIASAFGGGDWEKLINEDSLLKAAVFDFLIDARDRHFENFLIDVANKKIHLVDHDRFMFLVTEKYSFITDKVKEMNLEFSESIRASIRRLLSEIDNLTHGAKGGIKEILSEIKERAEYLLTMRTIPSIKS